MKNLNSLLDNLSYSEEEALKVIFQELGDKKEVVFVASKIVDQKKITRSVAVNAVTKLAIAEVVVTRSLGMKGTHIKVIDQETFEKVRTYIGLV